MWCLPVILWSMYVPVHAGLFCTNPLSYDALDPSNAVLSSSVTTTNAMLHAILLYFTLAWHVPTVDMLWLLTKFASLFFN